jgi:hypothetical protein
MAGNGEYIIDLDEPNGVMIGDLFRVLTTSEKIILPPEGKDIGYPGKGETAICRSVKSTRKPVFNTAFFDRFRCCSRIEGLLMVDTP